MIVLEAYADPAESPVGSGRLNVLGRRAAMRRLTRGTQGIKKPITSNKTGFPRHVKPRTECRYREGNIWGSNWRKDRAATKVPSTFFFSRPAPASWDPSKGLKSPLGTSPLLESNRR